MHHASIPGLTFRWLLLLTLTVLVAFSPGNSQGFPYLYFVVWGVTLVKGWIIIQDFMELKQAPSILRHMVFGWLLVTTSAVTLTAVFG